MSLKKAPADPEMWGLNTDHLGELMIYSSRVIDLAGYYGTPVHIVNEPRLFNTALSFLYELENAYKGKVSVHYAFKCNSVPAVIDTIKRAGLKAEVMTEFEFELARNAGYKGEEIILNGPCKNNELLIRSVSDNVKYIVIDSIEEMSVLENICRSIKRQADILFRINLNYTPKGIIKAAATGSKSSAFGLDIKTGEVFLALRKLLDCPSLNFCGFHFHIGSGIKDPHDYSRAIGRLKPVIDFCKVFNIKIRALDAGGGYGLGTTREFSNKELFLYHVLNILPEGRAKNYCPQIKEFASSICSAVTKLFPEEELPELILEPGRSITSQNQFLLVKVHGVKKRSGGKRFIITDGGLGTVALPVFYEYHEVILCEDVSRRRKGYATITGPCCFSSDVIYRNKLMPEINPGETLALMDSGAYFTQLESSFGYPHPAVVYVNENGHYLARSRESFEEYTIRDKSYNNIPKGAKNEIFHHQKR